MPRTRVALIVDDEPGVRSVLEGLLIAQGYQPLSAASGEEALRLLEGVVPSVVLTDVDMPGTMDGIRLAHFIRGRWPPIKLVVISGKIAVSASELPDGTRFFSKPYQDHKLHEAIAELLL